MKNINFNDIDDVGGYIERPNPPINKYIDVSDIIGEIFSDIVKDANETELKFYTDDGRLYVMYHEQDCYESVYIEDIIGDLDDLIGSPILMASEEISDNEIDGVQTPMYEDTFTWTFYKFATIQGYVTIRWFGQSNGYYSERVSFMRLK
jgi:hypothetical protein